MVEYFWILIGLISLGGVVGITAGLVALARS